MVLKTADIGWPQIEKSFKTAITIHPDLSHYHIFLACDLTGPTGRKKKDNTPASNGVEQWNDFKAKLTAYALTQSIKIDIHLNTLSDILTDISKPECVGLQEFWFGEIEINSSKLKDWYGTAQTDLGERYCSTDNVQVSARSAFKGLVRDTRLQNEIQKIKLKYNTTQALAPPNFAGVNCEQSATNVEVLLRDLLVSIDGLTTNLDVALPYIDVRASLRSAQEAFQRLQRVYWDIDTNNFSDAQKNEMSDFRKSIHKREDICEKLDALLSTHWVKSEEKRVLLLVGPAGIGKSHLLADQVRQEIENDGTALLFLGHWFSNPQAWETIASRLGKPNFNKDQLLGAINTRASAQGRRAIIAIDALNESIGGNWIRGLCSFAEDILKYPNITLAVSCRDVYVPYVIPTNFYAMANKITLLGFVSEDEVENAAKIFLDKRGIVRPALLWIAPEFSNPLFLKASALALHKQGKTEFPKGLQGSKEVFSFFIESIGASLGTPYDGSSAFLNILRVCLSSLAKKMAETKDDSIGESTANQIIESTFQSYPLPTGWLDALCKGGLLDCYPPFEENPDPFNPPENKIRFAYQRLQDHLIAEALLKKLTNPDDMFNGLPESLNFMTSENKHLDWRYWGLMEALSIQVAEKFGVEILDYYLDYIGDDFIDHSLSEAFVGSVRWRHSNAISDRTVELLHTCSRDDRDLLSLVVEFTFRDGHRLNADKLHKVLSDVSLPERMLIGRYQYLSILKKQFLNGFFCGV